MTVGGVIEDRDVRSRRRAWTLLAAWAALTVGLHARHPGASWFYFRSGAHLLLDPSHGGGVHLYATHPDLQIGPLSFAVARVLLVVPGAGGMWLAVLLMQAAGLLILALIADLADRAAPGEAGRTTARLVAAGLVFLPIWSEVAVRSAHLDDALALTLGMAGLHAAVRGRAVAAGLLLALATDSKPWALAFVAVLLCLPRREALRGLWVWCAAVAAAWLPFVVADHGTIDALRYQIANSPSSALRALGVRSAATPAWCRTAQLVIGAGLGALVARRAPVAVLFLVIAVRMLLDPGVHAYYDSTLLGAAVAVDILVFSTALPWLSLSAIVALYLPQLAASVRNPVWLPHDLGEVRADWLMLAIAVVVAQVLRRPAPADPAAPMRRPARPRLLFGAPALAAGGIRGIGAVDQPKRPEM